MRRLLLFVVAVAAIACRSATAPAPAKPCVPNFDNPDSSKVIPIGDTAVIKIAWCGPITVLSRRASDVKGQD